MNKKISWTWLPLVAALVLAGCSTPPAIDLQRETPSGYKEGVKPTADRASAPAEAPLPGDAQWWTVFRYPQLEALVARAADRNTDVQQAAARLAQARALAREVDSERMPQVGLGASAARGAGIDKVQGMHPANLFTAGLGASWELDLFGRLAGASRAASLDARSREALLQSTRLAVQSQTAQLYLAVRALDAEALIMQETVDAYRDTLQLTERRQRAGDLGELDVERVRTELAATESDALAVARQRTQVEHALAVVLGELPTGFSLPVADWTTALPNIPAGLPSQMLERRPDVQAAQWRVQAAQERVGVAQAAWFPTIALTADGGYASTDLGDLLKWSARSWGVGALLSLIGLAALLFGIIEGPERGWTDGLVVGAFVIAAVTLALFVLWELRSTHPMLPMEFFRNHRFSTGTGIITFGFLVMFGFFFLVTQYFQAVRGYSPLKAGVATLPFGNLPTP